jgi:hypothetical protein
MVRPSPGQSALVISGTMTMTRGLGTVWKMLREGSLGVGMLTVWVPSHVMDAREKLNFWHIVNTFEEFYVNQISVSH